MFQTLKNCLRERKARSLEQDISTEQWTIIETRLGLFSHLTPSERQRLRHLALLFLASKQMYGAQGLELNAAMQLSIALQACLPILHLGLEWYEGWVGIIVYPGDFIIPREEMDEFGVVHEFDDIVLGEAWQDGPVLLSWFDEGDGGREEGAQVVLHEFAHKLDMRNGVADGYPPLHAGMSRSAWQAAFLTAFEDFRHRLEQGEKTALDPYAAEAPAEFFAVMSEAFFASPSLLHTEYPDVYAQLEQFYRQSPRGEKSFKVEEFAPPESHRN